MANPGSNQHGRLHAGQCPGLWYVRLMFLHHCSRAQVAHDVAEGLAHLHPAVVHRDLKPQNILLDARGRAKIADFGISRVKVAAPPCNLNPTFYP